MVTAEASLDKITGPWLWMIAPTKAGQGGANSTNVDSLFEASSGKITEANVAVNGAAEGDTVGDLVWTLGEIAPTGGNKCHQSYQSNRVGQRRCRRSFDLWTHHT